MGKPGMISSFTFQALNIKQKIYKIAYAVREMEIKSTKETLFDSGPLKVYLEYLKSGPGHSKTTKAVNTLEKVLSTINNDPSADSLRKSLNFCFYELLGLIDIFPSEESFEPCADNLFDKNPSGMASPSKFQTAAILDNLRSPFNVGSIFRCADSLGCPEIVLCGITPHPPNPKMEKAAMGTLEYVPWAYFADTADAVGHYKENGFKIVALERSEKSIPIYQLEFAEPAAFILGNEEFGITDDILSLCDQCLLIPQLGIKNSMNVSNAFSILMYELMRRQVC